MYDVNNKEARILQGKMVQLDLTCGKGESTEMKRIKVNPSGCMVTNIQTTKINSRKGNRIKYLGMTLIASSDSENVQSVEIREDSRN